MPPYPFKFHLVILAPITWPFPTNMTKEVGNHCTQFMAEVDSKKVLNKPQSMPDPIAISEAVNYSKYILLLLITGGGHFRRTMTVDKDIMEFERKQALETLKRSWICWPLEVYTPCS
jgi:hypothetical protein